jgi:hypothetical protein
MVSDLQGYFEAYEISVKLSIYLSINTHKEICRNHPLGVILIP